MNEFNKKNVEVVRQFIAAKYPHLVESLEDDTMLLLWCLAMIAARIKREEIE